MNLFSLELTIAVIILFLCAVIQGYSGFGGGILVVPIMALLFDPVTGIALLCIPIFIGMLIIVPRAIPHVNWREVIPLVSLSALTILIGQNFLLSADPRNIKVAMGCLIICIAILFLKNWRYEGKRNIFTTGVVAVATGGATGAFGIPGGPIAVMYYLSARIEPNEQRANIILTGFLNTLVFLAGFIFHGVYKTVSIIDSSLLIPGFVIGITLGQYLFKVMPSDWFRKVTSIMLLVIGLVIIIV